LTGVWIFLFLTGVSGVLIVTGVSTVDAITMDPRRCRNRDVLSMELVVETTDTVSEPPADGLRLEEEP
jgi:hypothetical protein